MAREDATAAATPVRGRALEPERARERRQEYMAVLDEDRVARADALGLSHVGNCSDADPVADRLRCWRCYYIHARREE